MGRMNNPNKLTKTEAAPAPAEQVKVKLGAITAPPAAAPVDVIAVATLSTPGIAGIRTMSGGEIIMNAMATLIRVPFNAGKPVTITLTQEA